MLEQFASDNYSGICPEVMEYDELVDDIKDAIAK